MNSSNEEKNGANNGNKSEPVGSDSLKPGLPDIQTGDTLSLETFGSAYADTGIFRHVGKRESQQDAADCAVLKNADGSDKNIAAAVLCDGMGGMNGGERASNLCVSTIMHELVQIKENTDINHLLKKCLQSLDSIVYNLKDDGGERLKAGTTIVCAVMRGEKLYWASVGDSRLYLMHGENIIQLTRDHNYLADLMVKVEKGLITEEEALNDKRREALTSYIGCGKLSLIDIGENPITMEYDDVLLLCSDGIYRGLNNYEVLITVNFYNHDMVAAAKMLVEKTFEKDLPFQDNMTVVLMRYVNQTNTAQKPVMPPKAYIKYRATIPPVPKEDEMNAAFRAERAPKKKRRKLPSAALIAVLIGAALVILTMLSLTVWRRPAEDTGTDAEKTAKEVTEETESDLTDIEEESDAAPAGTTAVAVTEPETKPEPETEPETEAETEAEIEAVTEPDSVAATKITLSKSTIDLVSGGADTVAVTFEPVSAAGKIIWTSSLESVAQVNDEGKITAVSAGSTIITARTTNGKTAECLVRVESPKKAVEVSAIAVSPSTMTLSPGETATLTATVSPANAADKTVTLESSNNGVAAVAGGKVTAISEGTAVITVKTTNGKTETCTVTVKAPETAPIKTVEVSSVSISQKKMTLSPGETETLTAKVSPNNAADKKVIWTSSDPNIASIKEGAVTAEKEGTATITVKTSNGKTDKCDVTVEAVQASGISLNNTSLTLAPGKTEALTATISPSNTTDKNITWSSGNKGVATVSDKGNITAISEGTATITAKTSNGKTAACTVTVTVTEAETEKKIIADGICGINVTWTLSYDGELIIDGKGDMTNYKADNKADWYDHTKIFSVTINNGVTGIGENAFDGCSNLTKITIPESIKVIGAYAFKNCSGIKEISIPKNVTKIGGSVFSGCSSLTNIVIPNSVTDIAQRAFYLCSSLTDLTIPNSVINIGNSAFSSCAKLINITIPNSVTYIGGGAFADWTNEQTINIEGRSSTPSSWANDWQDNCKATINWKP